MTNKPEPVEGGTFRPHDPNGQLRFAFGSSWEEQADFQDFDAYPVSGSAPGKAGADWPANLSADWSTNLKSNGKNIDVEGLGVMVVASVKQRAIGANPAIVRVCVDIDPSAIPHLSPGRYESKIVLRAENFGDAAPIPVVVTLRARLSKGVILAFAGVVIGLAVKILTELGSGQRPGKRGPGQALRDYLLQWSFPLAIILGVVTGWLGYIEIYAGNPTWGADGTDSLELFGTCFAFQMAGVGGADIAKRLVG